MNSPQNDIFISYTHSDNYPPAEDVKGWVELFHRSLLALIKQIYEREISIWRDPKTHGNDRIEADVRQKIADASLLITILSPRYLTSRWCLSELRWFVRAAKQKGLFKENITFPIFKVAKTRTDLNKQPRVIREMLGYDFYHYDEVSDYITHFKQGAGVPYDPRYWENLDRLAQDIVKMLKIVHAKPPKPATETTTPQKVVYLADPTPDLLSEHKKIKDELRTRNYTIFPEGPLPAASPKLQDLIRDCLKRSSLSIHLVGRSYLELSETERAQSIIRLQNNLAAERLLRPNFSRLIWVPYEMRVTDALQVELVSTGGGDWVNGTEFLQSSLDELKAVTIEKLEGRKRRPRKPSSTEHKSIYLIYDKQDSNDVAPIYDCLFIRGYEVLTPSFVENAQSIERHKSKLAACHAVLIYYGKGNQDWLESHLDYLKVVRGIKSIDESESVAAQPLLSKAIYIAPPLEGHKRIFNTWNAMVIRKDEDFDCTHLQEFFDQVEGESETSSGDRQG